MIGHLPFLFSNKIVLNRVTFFLLHLLCKLVIIFWCHCPPQLINIEIWLVLSCQLLYRDFLRWECRAILIIIISKIEMKWVKLEKKKYITKRVFSFKKIVFKVEPSLKDSSLTLCNKDNVQKNCNTETLTAISKSSITHV